MLLCVVQLTYLSSLMLEWVTLILFGVGSGAAMIPYRIIKEVNPDRIKGSATGATNFLSFSVTAAIGTMFASYFGMTHADASDHVGRLRHSDTFWIVVIGVALLASAALRETGPGRAQPQAISLRVKES